jgi:NADH-quinone oxidoreductase subunit E
MPWKAIDRNQRVIDPDAPPVLSEAVREKIRSFFPRYDTKRAVLLPALHVVQDALGYVPWQAMKEIADLLEIKPSDVIDTISFYTHFWTHPKGKKVITACRSVSCEIMGGAAVLDELKKQLGIDEHGTTKDERYSLVTEECLAGCDHAPCLLINERLHQCVRPEDVTRILQDEGNDKIASERSELFDAPPEPAPADDGGNGKVAVGAASAGDEELEQTSDVREMREA